MKTIILLLVIVAGFLLHRQFLSFSAQRPEHYKGTLPLADLRTHLNGPIDCEGVIYGPLGRVSSRFVAKMEGVWGNRDGKLKEFFSYDSGNTQEREWTLIPGEEGHFTATAPDVIGEAKGRISGATISMTYKLRLPETAGGHVLNVTDWIYVMENGTMINRSVMRKFGIKVAELVATMRPQEAMLEAAE